MLKADILAELVPISRQCPYCQRIVTRAANWRLTATSDCVCKSCYDKDVLRNADIYKALAKTFANQAWRKYSEAIDTEGRGGKRNVRWSKPWRFRPAAPSDGEQCPRCLRPVYKGDNAAEQISTKRWVATYNSKTKSVEWVCRRCFCSTKDVAAGQYRQDSHGRVFIVEVETTDGQDCTESGIRLVARFPFGIRQIPPGSFLTGNQTIYDAQRDDIFKTIGEYADRIEEYAKTQCRHYSHVDPSRAYDVALDAAMYAASFRDTSREFGPYLRVAIRNAISKEATRNNHSIVNVYVDPDTLEGLAGIDAGRAKCGRADDKPVDLLEQLLSEVTSEDVRRLLIDQVLLECSEIFGCETWEILCQWVLGNRTMTDIGKDLGVIQQTISAKVKNAITKCVDRLGDTVSKELR